MKALIKLVVVNENTLGYIEPKSPTLLSVFRACNTTRPNAHFNAIDDGEHVQVISSEPISD